MFGGEGTSAASSSGTSPTPCHAVTVADNLSKGHEWAVPEGVELCRVDLLDEPALARLVGRGFDVVLHFAALSLVGESVARPPSCTSGPTWPAPSTCSTPCGRRRYFNVAGASALEEMVGDAWDWMRSRRP